MSSKNIRALSARGELRDNLFERISDLSEKNASQESFHELSKRFMIDDSVVYGTSSFYDFLKPSNRGHKVRVCNGTACMVSGTQKSVHDLLLQRFEEKEIGHVACVGRCHSNSAVMFKGQTFQLDSKESMANMLELEDPGSAYSNEYRVASNTTPILTEPVGEVGEYFSLASKFKGKEKEMLLELKNSKLRGRGGAGFPFWFKLDAVSRESSDQKYVVCNADEGDPGAYSDMYLMEQQPYKVLFGMYASGLMVGADTGVLYIRGEYPHSIRVIQESIDQLKAQGLIGDFRFKIIRGQGSYVCGEETALLNSIEGLRPEVRVRPPYPAQYGLFGKPTVLSNVETFANVHWILQNGGDHYASIGTGDSKGTKLVSLDGFFNEPGIYEIAMGTPLKEVFYGYGKGFKKPVKALQIGGPLGGIVPLNKIDDLQLDFESLQKAGFLLGHASVVCIPEDFPMIKFLEHLLEFTAEESCGKCYPCRIGSHRGFEMLRKAQEGSYKIDPVLFDDLMETLEIGSLCALGGGIPLPIRNAMHYFTEELQEYFEKA